jgi:hypothetical protein
MLKARINSRNSQCLITSHNDGDKRYIKPTKISRQGNKLSYNKMTYTLSCALESAVAPMNVKQISVTLHFDSLYRVVLRNGEWKSVRDAAKTVTTCVNIINFTWAFEVCKTARRNGNAIIVTVQESDAIMYRDRLIQNGLDAYIDEA